MEPQPLIVAPQTTTQPSAQSPKVQSKFDADKPQRVIEDRLTCYEIVTHQTRGQKARQFESRYQRILKSVEIQPYERNLTATEEWQPLDCGWIDKCGLLMIRNNEGRLARTIPTEEEIARLRDKVLEVSFSSNQNPEDGEASSVWLIHSGETMRACPSDLRSLRIRSRRGEVKYTLFIMAD